MPGTIFDEIQGGKKWLNLWERDIFFVWRKVMKSDWTGRCLLSGENGYINGIRCNFNKTWAIIGLVKAPNGR